MWVLECKYWCLGIVTIGILLFLYIKRHFTYWQRRGVPVHSVKFEKIEFYRKPLEWMAECGQLFGSYFFIRPALVVADPELLKQILIKDFHHFTNRYQLSGHHELWNKNLFSANDKTWKRLRIITSPSFSSGKLKSMHFIMNQAVTNLSSHLSRLCLNTSAEINPKKIMSAFTIDVIASTSFATQTNAHENENNPFLIHGRKLMQFSPLRLLSIVFLPSWFLRLMGIETMFPPEPFNFFANLSRHIVKQRKSEHSKPKHDLVQLLIDASVDQKDIENTNYKTMTITEDKEQVNLNNKPPETAKKLTDVEIESNCVFFFIAGFETTASTATHALFELAKNAHIQEQLYQELGSFLSKFKDENENEYFETVMNQLPYLDAFLKETLRKYPPILFMARICNTDNYRLGNVVLEKGQVVNIIPTLFHLNADYYKDPFTFDPSRFMPENKHLLVPYTYLPFSLGPRNCVAMRFAYQELKLCFASLVRKFKFENTLTTPDELIVKKGIGILQTELFSIKVSKR